MVGTTISHYRILERLGGGGMGVVYKAEDLRLGRLVAVKFLPIDLTRDPDAKARFIQEARSASAVNHPNISTIHDLDETPEGQLFIVQEYHGGRTLKDLLASKGRLGLTEALSIALQVAHGLAEVHRKGIIHRDIKPSNIMIAEDGIAKIVDFGLAKLQSRSTMTKEGVTVGTPSYMSPEQLRGTPSSRSTDVWGLGILLYEMLSGRRPFQSEFEEGVVYAILHESPPTLTELGVAVPEDLERVITRALQRNPVDRYPDMESIASDLQFIRRGVRVAGVRAWLLLLTRPGRRRTRVVGTAAVLIAALGLALLAPPLVAWWTGTRAHSVAIVSVGDRTGDELDPDLLYAVSHALARYLSAFPQLETLPVDRLADLGEQLGRPALRTEDQLPILSVGTAQDICRSEGIDRLLVGNIEKLPSGDYSLILELKNPRTNVIIATAVSPAARLRDLMGGIRQATERLVRELGVPHEEAVARLEALAATTTGSLDAYRHYALALHQQTSFRTGMFAYHIQRAIEEDSTFGAAYVSLAQKELQYFNFRAARQVYARARELGALATSAQDDRRGWDAPLTWQEHYGKAAIARRTALCREYVEEHPDDKVARTWLGRFCREQGEIPEAIRQEEKALDLDPSFLPALNELAWINAYMLEDFRTALEYINRVEALDPGSFVSSGTRACIRYMMGDIDHSIYLQGRAADQAPSWNARLMMAYVYALQEQYRVAEEQLAIHLSEANTPFMRAQGLLLRAHLQVWRGRFSDAQTPLRECVAIADSTDNGVLRAEAEWLRLWSALLAPGRPPTIELPDLWRDPAGLERVVNPWYPYYRGRSELRSGRPDSLEFYARQMEASEGSVIQRDRGFARCLATVLRRERLLAVDSAHAALALSPITPRVATLVPHINCLVEPGLDGPRTSVLFSFSGDMEARTYLAVGDTERAILEYERAMRQDPHRRLWIPPLYHYRLAALYDQMGASQRAIEEYEAFLSVWDRPDSAAAQPLLARKRLALLQGSAPRHLP